MTKYKLKKDARKFFDKNLQYTTNTIDFWKANEVTMPLLDEVDIVSVEYGHKLGENSETLSGFKHSEKEAHFEFTLRVNDMEYEDYQNANIPRLMDEIQKIVNTFFKR